MTHSFFNHADIQKFVQSPIAEHFSFNVPVQKASLFPYPGPQIGACFQFATLSFHLRTVNFDKKRALPFFLAIELLSSQKSVATLATRPALSRKLRKGRLVGCRVTLRNTSLFDFLDLLSFTLPRRESLTPPPFISRRRGAISTEKAHREIEADIQMGGRILALSSRRKSAVSTRRIASESFSFGELSLFPPFERGLGLHPDVQRLHLSFSFNSRSIEERIFILRSAKLPVALFMRS